MKYIKKLFIVIAILIGATTVKVNAATLNVNMNASASKVVVGNTITYTVTLSSNELLGSFRYGVTYDSSKLSHEGGTLNAAPYFDGKQKSVTYTFKFKAKASGTANVNFNIYEAIDWNFNNFSYKGTTTKSVTIITQQQLEASYSKNNNLSSLRVDGYELTPAFNKNTTKYSLVLENDVKEINISGNKEDGKSSVSGLGKHQVVEGLNKIEIKVTAQNGSTKTYLIEATVKELKPIAVKVDGNDFTVVRKKEQLKKPNDTFEDVEITIGEEDKIPAFKNNKTDTTLVGLKDAEGNVQLYIYKDNEYKIYKEYVFDSIIVTPASLKEIPKGYTEAKVTIGKEEVIAYKSENDREFYLINAVNIKTGEENLYQYNKKENTIQIFNKDILKKLETLEEKNTNYTYVIIGLGILLILTYLVILIKNIRKPKKKIKKNIEKEENSIEEVFEKEEEPKKKIEPKKEKEIEDVVDDLEALNIIEAREEKPKETKKVRKTPSRSKKNETFNEEIEKFIEKDGKIKEDISNNSKRDKK